ncbi:uncharacterized protein [Nicotiana tomentosiformis]|uniref:uncharacterized protein n=1 Tax=Nicotiana tomentosiformis TaxID=4098 RepID=UPI00388C7856
MVRTRASDVLGRGGAAPPIVDPATSQAGGGAHIPTAQAPGHATVVYQTPGALPMGGAQLVVAAILEPRPTPTGEPQKLLDRWTRLRPPAIGGSPPLTWDQFTRLFLERYIPPSSREELRGQFEQLQQGQMSVTDYEARFSELSRYALMILPTDAERVQRFIAGLHYGIQVTMARDIEKGTPYEQGSSSRSSCPQSQTQGQSSSAQRGCFECGDLGHMRRFYPKLRVKAVQLGHRLMITAPAAAPAIQLPIGRGQVGRGCPRGGGSTYSYVSSLFAHFLGVPRGSLGTSVYVSTPIGDSVVVDQICQSCNLTFCGYKTRTDLSLLDMTDFKVILGMDWLSPYHVVVDYHAKTVTLAILELPRLEWNGSSIKTPTIDSVPKVWEFSYVFPSNLLGMPPDRDIDLAPGTQPISIPSYHME